LWGGTKGDRRKGGNRAKGVKTDANRTRGTRETGSQSGYPGEQVRTEKGERTIKRDSPRRVEKRREGKNPKTCAMAEHKRQ